MLIILRIIKYDPLVILRRSFMKRIVIFTILIALALGAQESAFTLDWCIDRALEANYGLSMRREEALRSEWSFRSSLSSFMPAASTRFSWSRSGDDRVSYGETGLIVSRDHYSTGFSASQTLFSGGRNILNTKSARLARDISRENLSDREAELIYNVKGAFFSVIRSKESAENAKASLERIEDQYILVLERDRHGLADPTEITQIKVSRAQAELAVIQADNALAKAKESLAMLLSLPLDSDFDLIDSGTYADAPTLLGEQIRIALENSPQIRQAELAVKRAHLSMMSTWTQYIPGVNASYSYSWSGSQWPDDLSAFDDQASWSAGISASWTLFAGTSRIAGIQTANSQLRDAETNLKLVRQSLEGAVRDAFRRMEEARARIALADARLDDAKLNEELFSEKYGLGDCTLLELLQAELSLRQAETEAVNANFDYNIAIAELYRLTGSLEY